MPTITASAIATTIFLMFPPMASYAPIARMIARNLASGEALVRRTEPPSIALQDDVSHHRIDLVLPGAAREHAVMADAGLHVVALAGGAQRRAQVVRGQRLPDRADVVLLAFHRKQHGALDRRRLCLLYTSDAADEEDSV